MRRDQNLSSLIKEHRRAIFFIMTTILATSTVAMEDEETKDEPCKPYSYPALQYAADVWHKAASEQINASQLCLPSSLNALIADYAFLPAMIAAGPYSSFFMHDGQVWTCGKNQNGQLGDGTTIDRSDMQLTPIEGYLIQVASSYNHTWALTEKGALYGWGRDYTVISGPDDGFGLNPVRLDIDEDIIQVASGPHYSFALTRDGRVLAWMMMLKSIQPEKIVLMPIAGRVVQIAASHLHALALTESGQLFWWHTLKKPHEFEPQEVDVKIKGIVQIVGGNYFFLALTKEGQIWRWAVSRDSNNFNPIPRQIGIAQKILQIAAGSVGLTDTGEVWVWTTDKLILRQPVQVKKRIVQIATGRNHFLYLSYDDEKCSWELSGYGINDKGQLGRDVPDDTLTPYIIKIPGITFSAPRAGHFENNWLF